MRDQELKQLLKSVNETDGIADIPDMSTKISQLASNAVLFQQKQIVRVLNKPKVASSRTGIMKYLNLKTIAAGLVACAVTITGGFGVGAIVNATNDSRNTSTKNPPIQDYTPPGNKNPPATLTGQVSFSVNAISQHDIVTKQKVYQRTAQDVYQHDIWNILQRNVWDEYQGEVQNYEQREYYTEYRPVYERKGSQGSIEGPFDSYIGNGVDGGFFSIGNGFAYVTIDVAKATTEGYTVGISNVEHGAYIGYDYFVKIQDDILTVSFDERLVSVRAGIKIYNALPSYNPNSEINFGILSETVPADATEVYLFVRFAGDIQWHEAGEYEFVEYEEHRKVYSDYKIVDTVTTIPVFVEEGSDVRKVGTGKKERFIGTNYGEYELKETKQISCEKSTPKAFNGEFDIVVTNEDGIAYEGKIVNGQVTPAVELEVGQYMATLSGNGVYRQQEITIVADETVIINFENVVVIQPEQEIFLADDYLADNQLEPKWLEDNQLRRPEWLEDNQLPDVTLPPIVREAIRLDDKANPADDKILENFPKYLN